MDIGSKIGAMITPSLEAMGYRLVLVRMLEGGGRRTLQVMSERKDEAAMTVDDCADISRVVSALLDVEDPLSGAYNLEVSSPGIDRPLVTLEDYARFKGYEAKVETHEMIEGRKRFRGDIVGMDGGDVAIKMDGTEIVIPFASIKSAKLVMTDALMREHLNAKKKH